MIYEDSIEYFGEEWAKELAPLISSEYMTWLETGMRNEYMHRTIYPSWDKVFNAFAATPPSKLKVVILGDQPYSSNEATGIAFGVSNDSILPPRTIFDIIQVLENGTELCLNFDYSLHQWTSQGVLLLNSALTTIHKGPELCHITYWLNFTKYVINYIIKRYPHVVFLSIGTGYGLEPAHFEKAKIFHIKRNQLKQYGYTAFGRVNDVLDGQNGPDNIIKWVPNKPIYDMPF